LKNFNKVQEFFQKGGLINLKVPSATQENHSLEDLVKRCTEQLNASHLEIQKFTKSMQAVRNRITEL
jgi:hypothetical protein